MRLFTAGKWLTDRSCIEAALGLGRVVGGEFEAEVAAVELLGDDKRRPAPGEGVENDVALVRAGADDPAEELLGHLTAVPARAFVERAADAGNAPGIPVGGETVGDVAGTQDPGVVGESALGIGAGVGVNELAGRGDADRVGIEGVRRGVLHEVKQVGVASGELIFAIDAESVVPDHPASQGQADLAVGDHLQLGREFIADRAPDAYWP